MNGPIFAQVTDTDGANLYINLDDISHIYMLDDFSYEILLKSSNFVPDLELVDRQSIYITEASGLKLLNYLHLVDCSEDLSYQE